MLSCQMTPLDVDIEYCKHCPCKYTVWKTCLASLQKSFSSSVFCLVVPVTVSSKPDTFLLISNTVCIKVSCTVKCVRPMLREQTIYQKIKRKWIQNILLYKSIYYKMLIALHINVASQVSSCVKAV